MLLMKLHLLIIMPVKSLFLILLLICLLDPKLDTLNLILFLMFNYTTRHPLQALHASVVIFEPCTYVQAAAIPKWHAAMANYGLFYKLGSFSANAYYDSDWVGDPDDKQSTCGSGVYVGPNLISWSAKKQPIVSKSSTEGEYQCLALVIAEVYWLCMLLSWDNPSIAGYV
ncbi:hypothetical protein SADUNF_Sadunf16G0098200 [Salix dunnii]|uniref:Uncharacterized protein n=1 Tax=Salix dunnii TaxID=1413687 RepID=A0A835J917_9ROSI|nr:hypothetical protein SADUNF_Sadunf16G0098200 [Salix dunnii]